jgi:hypothetical protein
VTGTLGRLEARLDELRRQKAQLRADLSTAQQLFDSLQNEHRAAEAVCAEARKKTGYSGCLSDDKIAALSSWFQRLQQAASNGEDAGVVVGLRNWIEAARQTLKADQDAAAEARHQLSQRSELRGRLDALKAKARAYALAENDDLLAIAERAKSLLYTRPTPLQLAAACVAEYETKLNFEAAKIVRQ